MENAITGHCHCGQASYTVNGKVIKSSSCDCKGCQKASGTFRVQFVTVSRAETSISGKLAEYKADTTAPCDVHGVWCFCPTCGTHLFWKGNQGEELDIFAGTLDDPSFFTLTVGE